MTFLKFEHFHGIFSNFGLLHHFWVISKICTIFDHLTNLNYFELLAILITLDHFQSWAMSGSSFDHFGKNNHMGYLTKFVNYKLAIMSTWDIFKFGSSGPFWASLEVFTILDLLTNFGYYEF